MFANFASKESFVGIGIFLRPTDWSTSGGSGPGAYNSAHETYGAMPQGCLIIECLRNSMLRRRPRNARQAIGFPSREGRRAQTKKILGLPPVDSGYDGNLDRANYSSLLAELSGVFTGTGTHVPNMLKEHNVVHSHYDGEIRPVGVFNDLYKMPYSLHQIGNLFIPTMELDDGIVHAGSPGIITSLFVKPSGSGSYIFTYNPGSSNDINNHPWYFVDKLLSYLSTLGSSFTMNRNIYPVLDTSMWTVTQTVSNLNWNPSEDTDNPVVIDFDYVNDRQRLSGPRFRHESWHCRIVIDSYRPPAVSNAAPIVNQNGEPRSLVPSDVLKMTYEFYPYDSFHIDQFGNRFQVLVLPGSFAYSVGQGLNAATTCLWTKPSTDNSGFGDAMLDSFGPVTRAATNELIVRRDLPNLTASCFFSSSDAVEKCLEVIKGNNLQSLQKLPDLATLVPDVRLLVTSIIEIKSGNLMGLVQFGDFVAETWLKYKFGVEPNLRLISQLNGHTAVIMDKIQHLGESQFQEVHGSFNYDLPYAYFPDSGVSHLTTRSKLIVEWCDTSLFRSIVGVRSLGILPDMAGLWSIIPGSFIVDWFLNMSRRYKDVTSEALMLACRMFDIVHSYTVTGEINGALLSAFNLKAATPTPRFKVYIRHRSMYIPTLKDGRYDFRSPQQGPALDLVAALLWVLFPKK